MNRFRPLLFLLLLLPLATSCGLLDSVIGGDKETLRVEKRGGGDGTVTSDPAGVACGSVCSAPFAKGAIVTLVAEPDARSGFGGWDGDCDEATGTTCTLTMADGRSVGADFLAFDTPLTVTIGGAGVVASDDGRLVCPEVCSVSFAEGDDVALTAYPATGARFVGWGGVCSGAPARCTLSVGGGSQIPATFGASDGTSIGPTSHGCAGVPLGSRCQLTVSLLSPTEAFRGVQFAVESGAFDVVDVAPTGAASGCLASAGRSDVVVVCNEAVAPSSGSLATLTLERRAGGASVVAVVDAYVATGTSAKRSVSGGAVAVGAP